jgi:hypothetical protein
MTTTSEKLRSTCNNCALSKVRCNKKKPVCQRCETHKLPCVYGPSQRRGKPLSTAQHQSVQYPWTNNSDPFDMMNPISLFSNPMSSASSFTPDLWPTYSPPSLDTSGSSGEDSSVLIMSDINTNTNTTKATLEHNPNPSVRLTFAPLDSPCVGETCASTVFCTLGTLCQMGAVCNSDMGAEHISSGIILKTNRLAIQRLQELLRKGCEHCVRQTNLAFLLSTALSKIIAWYRAVFDGMADPSAVMIPTGREPVSMTPITVGDFQLDPGAQTRMKAQLLLCELQNVGPILSLVAQRNSKIEEAAEVHTSMENYLRSSLDQLTTEVNRIVVLS